MTSPLKAYQQQVELLNQKLRILEKQSSIFGWLRLVGFVFVVLGLWWSISEGSWFYYIIPACFIGIFLFLVKKHAVIDDEIKNLERLVTINESETMVLHHNFTHLPDGEEFKPANHEYANDLDIFGRASLFQFINRCNSEQGKKLIASWFLNPSPSETIRQRQELIKELAPECEWRQQLQSYGIARPITSNTQEQIERWLRERFRFLDKAHWTVLRFVLPIISFTILGLSIAGIISIQGFLMLIVLMMVVSFSVTRLVIPEHNKVNKIAPELQTLSSSVQWIEKANYKSKLFIDLKSNYFKGRIDTSGTIKKLKNILERLDIRLNPVVFLPLNTFFFWDLQQVLALEKWKKDNKQNIGEWFETLAEIESISSLANLSFNNPGWAFPTLDEKHGLVVAENLGHPLIPKKKCVPNSFSTEDNPGLSLITGSNMAGKSTFLRSIGVNIVLAMMGSPVCAESFRVSNMKAISCMRVNDNLEENTSTFYAELKKLKEVIEAVYREEKVYLLLDEILRGTNSADRQAGSKALIRQLVKHNAVGLIATHDLELTKLADEFPNRLHNFHFDVQVSGEELYFDYKLKKGICQSMNASLLMKKIGIEL